MVEALIGQGVERRDIAFDHASPLRQPIGGDVFDRHGSEVGLPLQAGDEHARDADGQAEHRCTNAAAKLEHPLAHHGRHRSR